MRLRDDLDALEALVGRISDETGIPFEHSATTKGNEAGSPSA